MAWISTSAMFAVEGQRPAQASRWLTALLVIVYGIKKEKHIELQAQTYRASLPLSLSLSLSVSHMWIKSHYTGVDPRHEGWDHDGWERITWPAIGILGDL